MNGHDAYVVVGVPQGDAAERLYFDTQSGLLLRKQTVLPTPVGNSPFQMDFDDYRDTGSGVKFPFVIHMNPANPRTELAPNATLRVTKVEDNKPIEDARFVKPAAESGRAPVSGRSLTNDDVTRRRARRSQGLGRTSVGGCRLSALNRSRYR